MDKTSSAARTTQTLFNTVLEILYPLKCGGCGTGGAVLCGNCVTSFRQVEPSSACPLCGRPVGAEIICGSCISGDRGFQEGLFGFYFENRLRDAIHAFKFQGRKDVGRRLVQSLEKRLAPLRNRVDCIIPMPVTAGRARERGFNQAFIIGEEISRMIGKPIYHSVLKKVRQTADQYSLSREDRRKNVCGAFAVTRPEKMKGKRVLLVDDLFTTGYTSLEASRALGRAEPAKLILFALARTPS